MHCKEQRVSNTTINGFNLMAIVSNPKPPPPHTPNSPYPDFHPQLTEKEPRHKPPRLRPPTKVPLVQFLAVCPIVVG